MKCQLCGSKDHPVWYSCLIVCPKCKKKLERREQEHQEAVEKYGR